MCVGRGWRCCYMVQPAHHPWTITSLHSRARATRGVRRPTGAPHSTIHALQRQTNSRDRCIFIRGMFRSARAHSERNPPHVETTDYTLDNRWPHRTTYHHGVLLVHAPDDTHLCLCVRSCSTRRWRGWRRDGRKQRASSWHPRSWRRRRPWSPRWWVAPWWASSTS